MWGTAQYQVSYAGEKVLCAYITSNGATFRLRNTNTVPATGNVDFHFIFYRVF